MSGDDGCIDSILLRSMFVMAALLGATASVYDIGLVLLYSRMTVLHAIVESIDPSVYICSLFPPSSSSSGASIDFSRRERSMASAATSVLFSVYAQRNNIIADGLLGFYRLDDAAAHCQLIDECIRQGVAFGGWIRYGIGALDGGEAVTRSSEIPSVWLDCNEDSKG